MSRCTQCGSCCRHIQFKLRVPDLKDQEFYRARGFTVRGEKVEVDVPHVCPQLSEDNRCLLHGDFKPVLCKIYPIYVKGKDLNDGCGYKD